MKRKMLLCALAIVCLIPAGARKVKDRFHLGADIGWTTEMEAEGAKFYNAAGEERECTALMKEYGLDAIRLRVWMDPSAHGNYCSKEDVLVKALRAKALGMDIMIDFHYSDWWADPGKQNIPAAWRGHSYEQMKQHVADHTIEVLEYLKRGGITPKWVQVGNETTHGFLWTVKTDEHGWTVTDSLGNSTIIESVGRAETQPEQYAGLFAAGYDAVKKVFPKAIVIVHLDNGFDKELYTWNLDILRKHGARFDMVGMSLYPYWAIESRHEPDADKTISDCIANIRYVAERYKVPVMVVETGMDAFNPVEGKRQLERVIRECRDNTGGHCKGVFYWEPACKPSKYRLGAFSEDGHPTEIMDAFREAACQ